MSTNIDAFFDQISADFVENGRVPGLSIAVNFDGQFRTACYGFADLLTRMPVHRSTAFGAGSITKQFVAAATVLACHESSVDLDAALNQLLPGAKELPSSITVRRLLSHSSGIRSSLELSLLADGDTEWDLAGVVAHLSSEPLHVSSGQSWFYSNIGYYLVGHLVQRLVEMPLSQYLRKRLLDPSGLDSSYFIDEDQRGRGVAVGYRPGPGGHMSVSLPRPAVVFASGSLVATPTDLVKWGAAVWINHAFGPAMANDLAACSTPAGGGGSSYGLGTYCDAFGGHRERSHDGNSAGFSSQVAAYPDDNLAVAVMSNSSWHMAETVEKRISGMLLGVSEAALQTTFELGPAALDELAGCYSYGATQTVVCVQANGLLLRTPSGRLAYLSPTSARLFLDLNDHGTEYAFEVTASQRTMSVRKYGKLLAVLEARD